MAKFCGKCGAKLNEETGKCPNCDKTEVVKNKEDIQNTTNNLPGEQKQHSKKKMKAEKKELKRQTKKDKKKQKRAQLTTKQRSKDFSLSSLQLLWL